MGTLQLLGCNSHCMPYVHLLRAVDRAHGDLLQVVWLNGKEVEFVILCGTKMFCIASMKLCEHTHPAMICIFTQPSVAQSAHPFR